MAPESDVEAFQIQQCVSFEDWAGRANLGTGFSKDGFEFESRDGRSAFAVMSTRDGIGLRAMDSGLVVALPGMASEVLVRAGAYGPTPLLLVSLDEQGTVIERTSIPDDNLPRDAEFSGDNLAMLAFTGGDNEAVIFEICAVQDETPSLADLRVSLLDWTIDEITQELAMNILVENLGGAPSLDTEVLVTSPTIERSVQESVGPLSPGDSAQIPVSFPVADDQRGRAHTLILEIDPANRVPEMDEDNVEEVRLAIPPREVAGPDLALSAVGWEVIVDQGTLVIGAVVENVGDLPSPETNLVARSVDFAWEGESGVPSLDSGESSEVQLLLPIPVGREGTTNMIVTVDADNAISELDETDNQDEIEVLLPPGQQPPPPVETPPSPPDLVPEDGTELPWELIVSAAALVSIALGGLTLTVRHTRKLRLRRQWEERAEDETSEEEGPCEEGLRRCRRELDVDVALRRVTRLRFTSLHRESDFRRVAERAGSDAVEFLNRAINARRGGERREVIQELIESAAISILEDIAVWMSEQPEPVDVRVDVHLEGSEAKATFILERCNHGVWEEEDRWEAKVQDESDAHLGDIDDATPSDTLWVEARRPEIAQQISRFIEMF